MPTDISLDPELILVQQLYDRLAASYDAHYLRNIDLAENLFIQQALHPLNLTAADHVLDIGCGTGLLLDLLPIPRSHYTGIDISEQMLARSKQKYPGHTFLPDNINASTLPSSHFDRAISLFALSHNANPSQYLLEIDRLLCPGGQFALMLFGPRYRKRKHCITYHTGTPIYTYNFDTLQAPPFSIFNHCTTTSIVPINLPTLEPLQNLLPVNFNLWLLNLQTRLNHSIRNSFYFYLLIGQKALDVSLQ